MVDAQEWLNKNYPKRLRKEIKELDISGKELKGTLNLSGFSNLEKLECSDNEIFTITNIDSLNCKKLTYINLRDNCINDTEISIFGKFVHLKTLLLGRTKNKPIYNDFFGSLEHLTKLKELENLCINDTKINEGFEYIPDSVKEFWVSDLREKLEKPTEEKGKLQLFIEEIDTFYNGVQIVQIWKKVFFLKKALDTLQEEKNRVERVKKEKDEEIMELKNKLEILEAANDLLRSKYEEIIKENPQSRLKIEALIEKAK